MMEKYGIGKRTMERVNITHFNGDIKKSTFFSPNLRKFIKKHPHFTQIFVDTTDNIWYIGYKDENGIWCGTKLLAALCKGNRTKTFSYAKSITDRFKERTYQFWSCTAYMGRRMFKWY
ncbi:MAG: hypothetical protein PHT69_02595 [Bacteroidales bacterium]|nr:hypothetical protein [Bacteroidales bacterium]